MRMWKMAAVASAVALAAFVPATDQDTGVTVEIAIGKNVVDRMPTDTASAFPADVGSLVCWTKVTGAEGQKITHTWTHGEHTDEITLNVGGSPWRTYSRKTIPADWTGEWKVEVKDSAGVVLATKTFTVGQ
jgi:hypothetical protein